MSTVLTTGANKGLGRGFVEKYLVRPGCCEGSKLVLVKIESTSETDALEAVRSIESQGILHLDFVIANARVFKAGAFLEATLPLLKAAKQPRFIAISSAVSTITYAEYIPYTVTSYGASKAALNSLLRRIHIENPELIAIASHPGAVKTDEGNKAAQAFGFSEAFVGVKDAVDGVVSKMDAATREESSGRFLAFDDTQLVW
ncbi:hypothetical protein KCU93_g7838, partial [Aureobasidium melanogenum]